MATAMDDITELTFEQIATGLRAWAHGLYVVEAAVEVLLAHRAWLRRVDFRRAALWISDDNPAYIGVDWTNAARFAGRAPASGSEIAMLRVAVGLAGQEVPESLGDLLSGLDQANIAIVLDAVAHAAGWHERGTVAFVTGGFASVAPA